MNITDNPFVAVDDADAVMTDTVVSIGKDEEKETRIKFFLQLKYPSQFSTHEASKKRCHFHALFIYLPAVKK